MRLVAAVFDPRKLAWKQCARRSQTAATDPRSSSEREADSYERLESRTLAQWIPVKREAKAQDERLPRASAITKC